MSAELTLKDLPRVADLEIAFGLDPEHRALAEALSKTEVGDDAREAASTLLFEGGAPTLRAKPGTDGHISNGTNFLRAVLGDFGLSHGVKIAAAGAILHLVSEPPYLQAHS